MAIYKIIKLIHELEIGEGDQLKDFIDTIRINIVSSESLSDKVFSDTQEILDINEKLLELITIENYLSNDTKDYSKLKNLIIEIIKGSKNFLSFIGMI